MQKTPISRIVVAGFKSINAPQELSVRRLTIIAGANSAGKSSMMQPLLLLKQSIESAYDPGALKLTGANAKYSSGNQVLSRGLKGVLSNTFSVGIEIKDELVTSHYEWENKKGFEVTKVVCRKKEEEVYTLLTAPDVLKKKLAVSYGLPLDGKGELPFGKDATFSVKRDRSYFKIVGAINDNSLVEFSLARDTVNALKNLIHLPGLRGNPERTYPVSAVGKTYPGLFQDYTASLMLEWESTKNTQKLAGLRADMKKLGLSWKVRATRKDDTQVEIVVGRLPLPKRGGAQDLVNIADVGLGVSQTLPLLVALHAATDKHLIYIEQPEIHLHPKAQVLLAEVIVSATKRGATIILETHSSIMIRKIQTLVAVGEIDHSDVSLNWFSRDDYGYTVVKNTNPDEAGAYGDWPEDFDDVSLKVESEYLTAVEKRRAKIRKEAKKRTS